MKLVRNPIRVSPSAVDHLIQFRDSATKSIATSIHHCCMEFYANPLCHLDQMTDSIVLITVIQHKTDATYSLPFTHMAVPG